MIRNQWYVILESAEVKKGKPFGVTRMGEKLVLWRNADNAVVCMRDLCPHLGAPLSLGEVKGDCIMCPFHGFEYDSSGQCTALPAYGRNGIIPKALRAGIYPTHEEHGFIWIFWGEPQDEIVPPKYFDNLGVGMSYGRFRQHWTVHYSRMVENQLDVAHLPFIHHNTIGRGQRTVVDGPLVRLEDDLLEIWVHNRSDDGNPPRKAEDLPEPTRHPFLLFRFPNIWQNWISDDIRIVIAFVPVDEENGLLYGRYYQNIVRTPVLKELFNLAGVLGSIVIANQDRRVVSKQLPKKTDLRMGEKIMQSDRAILTYRKRRRELQEKAGQTLE